MDGGKSAGCCRRAKGRCERTVPLRKKSCGASGSIEAEAAQSSVRGAERRKRSAVRDAVLNTVHAGGEQGWKSGHLEPFLFCLAPQIDTDPHGFKTAFGSSRLLAHSAS